VKVITMNDVIGELKKERKGCYDANSTLQPKPGHCGHEMRRIRSRPIAAALKELEKDPCLCCKYKPQGTCAYFLDGRKQEDACMDKLIYIKWMVRHAPDVAIRREAYEQGAREERERIIDLLLPIFAEDNRSPFELEGCPNCDRTIRMYLESLRGGKEK
jgi:hypothetical protein